MELPYGYTIRDFPLSDTTGFGVYHHDCFLFAEPTAKAAFDRLVRYHAVMYLNALGEPEWRPQKSNQGVPK